MPPDESRRPDPFVVYYSDEAKRALIAAAAECPLDSVAEHEVEALRGFETLPRAQAFAADMGGLVYRTIDVRWNERALCWEYDEEPVDAPE